MKINAYYSTFVAIAVVFTSTIPVRADEVWKGWFKSVNNNQTEIVVTTEDRSRLRFGVTPSTRVLGADGKDLRDRFKSSEFRRGVKIVVTVFTREEAPGSKVFPRVAKQVVLKNWK